MAELFQGKIPIIRRDLNDGFIRGTPSEAPSFGCVPRDFAVDPVMMGDSPDAMKVIPASEWDARFDEQEATGSSLQHIYLPGDGNTPAFEFLDQNGFPDCWAHSSCHAMMMSRIVQNLPPLRFNAVAVATLLGQTNGGWCGLSMKFAREQGLPVVGTGPGQWPYQSRSGKDSPTLRAEMVKHKDEEDWYDLGKREYDQQLARLQLSTCGFNNWPAPTDYNAYGHSMMMMRWVRIEAGAWGRLTLNSWKGFGFHGLCVIPETTANVDNSVALRSGSASIN